MTTRTHNLLQLIKISSVAFGTSGARGLVTNMTDQVCYAYTTAFLNFLEKSNQIDAKKIALAGDLRPSTPQIMLAIAKASCDKGYSVINCGRIPSPALALYGITKNLPSIMVTGSHIPDNRNGIKFNKPTGEISKEDEIQIKAQELTLADLFTNQGYFKEAPQTCDKINLEAQELYIKRYTEAFSKNCLQNKTIGFYQHSAVGRDLLPQILQHLGAKVIPFSKSDSFVSVDTEAIRQEDIELAKEWTRRHSVDALFTTDGDSDRPLIANEKGEWIRGDITGILVSQYLKVPVLALPISCNSAVEKSPYFTKIQRTQIGSPHVIKAMQQLAKTHPIVAGYEANGGYLTQTSIPLDNQTTLAPLPTRDALITIIAVLGLTKKKELTPVKAHPNPAFSLYCQRPHSPHSNQKEWTTFRPVKR